VRGARKPLEHALGRGQVDARVGNALAIAKRLSGLELLATRDQVAFQHHTQHNIAAVLDLLGQRSRDGDLARVVFLAVSVTAVDEHTRILPGALSFDAAA